MDMLHQSFLALARINGATVLFDRHRDQSFCADVKTRELHLGVPDGTDEWYFRSLHELAHIVLGHEKSVLDHLILEITGVVTEGIVENEAAAWLWAFDHASIPLQVKECDSIAGRFGTYAVDAVSVGENTKKLVSILVERSEQ